MTIHSRPVVKALRKSILVDPFLCSRYSFSPYMACGHGCLYCDGRSERYWVEGDFEQDIVARSNIAAVLREELAHLRERAPVAIGSGISDAYQPVEEHQKLMRECATVIADAGLPATLLTKAALVMRDADAWERVNSAGGFILNLSLATLDDSLRRRFEPKASGVEQRLEVIREFRKRGIAVGVMAMPLLPFLGDEESDIRALLRALKDAGAAFVMPGGLTLRPGRQKEFFFSRLSEAYPALVPRYRETYAEERESGAATYAYRRELAGRITRSLSAAAVSPLLPHALYRDRLPLYDEVHLLLQHMAELYGARGIPTQALRTAASRYAKWLGERKRAFNRRRRERQADLEEETRSRLSGDNGVKFLGNEKFATFLRSVVQDRKILDYTALSLADPGPEAD